MMKTETAPNPIRMTQYSHGSGCGCKISPKLLEDILKSSTTVQPDPRLLVGNGTRDDAAVYDLGNGASVISTTDFFMPIVDDPFEFGQIAAANAISDIYAMGGRPLVAIAIFGWPIDKLGPEVARRVIDGGRRACEQAGIQLAGGHSIDAPEPIFGLAVTGTVETASLVRNDTAEPGCRLYLTKPLGIGIYTTAEKHGKLRPEHERLVVETMCRLNDIGGELGTIPGITAMTDVTGFGLLGHLLEICEGSGVCAEIRYDALPKLPEVESYLQQGCSPGGAQRNFDSYGHKVAAFPEEWRKLLCDPQTSGGLLVAVALDAEEPFHAVSGRYGLELSPIGILTENVRTDGLFVTMV